MNFYGEFWLNFGLICLIRGSSVIFGISELTEYRRVIISSRVSVIINIAIYERAQLKFELIVNYPGFVDFFTGSDYSYLF